MIRRLFPSIRSSETSRFRFFFLLAALLFSSQAVAMTVCESMLLSRLGIEALPYSVLAASALTLVCSFFYGKWVTGKRYEDSLLQLVAVAVTVIACSAPFVLQGSKPAYVAIFAFHFVTFTIFSQHLQALAGDYFDTLAAKRVLPLIGIGATVGEISGGLSSSLITRLIPVEGLLALWAGLLIAAALFTATNRARLALWNPGTGQGRRAEPSKTRDDGSRSPLARALVVMVCLMIFTMSMTQYVVSDVFVNSFPSESDLAAFLGAFVACSNALEMVIASQFTPRLLRRLGVARTNTIHAFLAVVTLSLLWSSYTLLPAILAWMNRKTVHDALAGPVRRLVFNALPASQRVSTMAFIDGVAGSAARAAASLFLFLLQGSWPVIWFVITGIAFAALYLLSALRVAREYLSALVREVSQGQLTGVLERGVAGDTKVADGNQEPGEISVWQQSGGSPATLEELFALTEDPSDSVREAAVRKLGGLNDPLAYVLLCRCLENPESRLRQLASQQLSNIGTRALPYLKPYFRAPRHDVAEAAYHSLRGVDCPSSRELLGQELRLLVREAWRNLVLQSKVRALNCAALDFLQLALEDRAEHCRRLAFKVLGVLEGQVVTSVMSSLRFSDASGRSTALELLSNLGDREAADLLVLLTEDSPLEEKLPLALKESRALATLPNDREGVLNQCLQSPGKYVSLAVTALKKTGAILLPERLLTLSTFELFRGLALEELELVNDQLVVERFSAGEPVLLEGSVCPKVYLLVRGRLSEKRKIVGVVSALDQGPAARTVRAESNSELWSLSYRRLEQLVHRQPGVAFPLLGLLTNRLKENERLLKERNPAPNPGPSQS